MIDLLIGFYISFQLIYGYTETNCNNDDDEIETSPPFHGQGVLYTLQHIGIVRRVTPISRIVQHAGQNSGPILP